MRENFRGDQFIYQDPAMLWVVAELDDIEVVVGSLDEVRLCTASHLSNVPPCGNRHRLDTLEVTTTSLKGMGHA